MGWDWRAYMNRRIVPAEYATKLTVRSQLCTRGGNVVLEHTVDGNVCFLGSNLQATHNLARNVAKTIKQSALTEPALSVSLQGAQ